MLLGVAAAGVGASVVAGAEPADALTTDGIPKVKLGDANTATATTSISMAVNTGSGVEGIDTSSGGGYGLYGTSANGTGIYGTITGGTRGHNAIEGVDASTGSGGGAGVTGSSTNGTGVIGTSTNGVGVTGIHSTGSGTGVAGVDDSGNTASHGVYGSSGSGCGVYGTTSTGTGVFGNSTGNDGYGVYGNDSSSDGAYGVYGKSTNGTAVYGTSTNGFGVYAITTAEGFTAVVGSTSGDASYGVAGYATGENGTGVVAGASGSASLALSADGNAEISGSLSKGGGSFKIDHPLDPAGRYLYHSFVESPDMKNVYDGTVTLDRDGRATVELPEWFEALNRDFRYQLTALLGAAPELHVSALVADGEFSIAGGKAGQQVSWQVTGIRQDAWANANRIPVEVDKPEEDHGRYLHPELFGGEPIAKIAKARDRIRRHHSTTPTASKQVAQ
jgi:hypothetical protein